jgi:hypothetical protein
MGLASSVATAGRVGYEERHDYTAIGSVVNLASRLCSAAADGQILMDAAAAAGIAGVVALEPLGIRPLKGFAAPVPIYAVSMTAAQTNTPTRDLYGAPHSLAQPAAMLSVWALTSRRCPLLALARHDNGCRQRPLSPRKQTNVHDLAMPVYEFTP